MADVLGPCHRARPRRSLSAAEWLALSALPLLAAAWAGVAHGDTLTVQATVTASCSAETATLDFGAYESGQTADVDGSTAITIDCSTSSPITIKLGAGDAFVGGERGMRANGNGTDILRYNLYLTDTFTEVWGDGTFGGTKSAIIDQLNPRQTVYGRIRGGQDVAAGSYSDEVAITVEMTP